MACRLAFILLVALHSIIDCSSTSFAATPLVVSELDAMRKVAEADSARAAAEQGLAVWKLGQLQKLQNAGHASWLEVAQQQVVATSATASATAANQYLQALLDCQARVAKLNVSPSLAESECVRLYMPGSPRLVAWMSTDVASLELSKRHLENLRREHQTALDIDLGSLETATGAAEKAVEIYSRRESDAHLLRRAQIRLQLATAEYESATARKEAASIVARRMAIIQASLDAFQTEKQFDEVAASPVLARAGTRFVDATGDRELTALVKAMAVDETTSSERIGWLEQQRDTSMDRIGALQTLPGHARFDRGELDAAKQQHTDLELQIHEAQKLLRLQQRIVDSYEQWLDLPSTCDTEQLHSVVLDDASMTDANIVRHWRELQQIKLQAAASRTAIEAQRDYLVERMKRVERIPAEARPPKELDHVRQQVKEARQQLETVGRELVALRQEQNRFCCQVQSQRGNQYQLVQAGKGGFIPRQQFEIAEALIAAIGFVGQSGLFAELPNTYPYIESTILIDCLSDLRVEQSGLRANHFSCPDWECADTFPRRMRDSSIWTAPDALSGLGLATDWITYPGDLFCYTPYSLRPVDWRDRWASSTYMPSAGRYRFRSCYPYGSYDRHPGWGVGYGVGLCGRSVFSYRIGCPTRNSFPYRSSYLYQTAFPTRCNLYSNPYARPSRPFSGLGYTTWLNASCFD